MYRFVLPKFKILTAITGITAVSLFSQKIYIEKLCELYYI